MGTTTLGTELLGPGHIRALGSGETVLGALGPASSHHPERTVLALSAAGLPSRVADDTLGVIWAKVAFNCVMNTLCAIASNSLHAAEAAMREDAVQGSAGR